MSGTYDAILDARKLDMTSWLIHFTRDNDGLSGRQVFIKILAEGALRPGFAIRGERRTAYGRYPVVCFTEMTIAALTHYIRARKEQNQMCPYGLLLQKKAINERGGRPVIYGLRSPVELKEGEDGYVPDARTLRDADLPLDEQYRYVAFDLTRTPSPIDWTHEREWRWRAGGSKDGILLWNSWAPVSQVPTEGEQESGIVHAFVENDAEIEGLGVEIRSVWERSTSGAEKPETISGISRSDTEAWREEGIKKVKVISLETAKRKIRESNPNYLRFEDWPEQDKYPIFK